MKYSITLNDGTEFEMLGLPILSQDTYLGYVRKNVTVKLKDSNKVKTIFDKFRKLDNIAEFKITNNGETFEYSGYDCEPDITHGMIPNNTVGSGNPFEMTLGYSITLYQRNQIEYQKEQYEKKIATLEKELSQLKTKSK